MRDYFGTITTRHPARLEIRDRGRMGEGRSKRAGRRSVAENKCGSFLSSLYD